MLGFNCGLRAGRRKDASRNINLYRKYVVNIADESLLEDLHLSSEDHPPEASEVEVLGLKTASGVSIRTQQLADVSASMECWQSQVLSFGSTESEFFVGEVLQFDVRDDLYSNGKIDTKLLRPICRLGGPTTRPWVRSFTIDSVGCLPSDGG